MMDIFVRRALVVDVCFAGAICEMIRVAAEERGTGIANRTSEYIIEKMISGDAIIAFWEGKVVGFCYLEPFTEGTNSITLVATSGLIVASSCRGKGVAKKIKHMAFDLARERYPNATLVSITTNPGVIKMNLELGFEKVNSLSKLTTLGAFWNACRGCVNYSTLKATSYAQCKCTGMLHIP